MLYAPITISLLERGDRSLIHHKILWPPSGDGSLTRHSILRLHSGVPVVHVAVAEGEATAEDVVGRTYSA